MKPIFICILISLYVSNLYAQVGCDVIQFKELASISKKSSITDMELNIAVQLLKKLEQDKCSDYIEKNGSVIAGRTYLFGEICLKKNNEEAVSQYINYLNRQHGSAEEELSYALGRLFQKQPKSVLLQVRDNKYLLDHLVWGFLNNHYYSPGNIDKLHKKSKPVTPQLNINNYKKIFFDVNPQIKELYPEHKKQLDYLLHSIYLELKG